jgi:hypothetical protein
VNTRCPSNSRGILLTTHNQELAEYRPCSPIAGAGPEF